MKERSGVEEEMLPMVSILISVRNESTNLRRLCVSLQELNYPTDKFEILIGDDGSDDDSLAILSEYAQSHWRIFSYHHDVYGKQQTLKKMYQEAKGDMLLFTDADMSIPSGWVSTMLRGVDEGKVLQLGLTKVRETGWFSVFQSIDWVSNQLLIKWLSDRGMFLTAWGNNMCLSKSTLEAVRFESLPDSVVEDVSLMRTMIRLGGEVRVNDDVEAIAITQAEISFKSVIQQRMRWLQGVVELPIRYSLLAFVKILFLPLVLFLSFYQPVWLLLILAKALVLTLLLYKNQLLNLSFNRFVSICFIDLYEVAIYFSSFALHVLPVKFEWKGRKYR
ncbi:glycosyltransferase [Reichenbachiella agariperforans]|nr:glycosyltransferase [Reichenbachiella agariperforans]